MNGLFFSLSNHGVNRTILLKMNIFCTPLGNGHCLVSSLHILCPCVSTYFGFIDDVSGRERGDGKAEQTVVGRVQRLDLTG